MTDANRRRNVQVELDEAERCRRAAEALAGLGLHKDALNRLYYSAYHLCQAVLLTEGLEPRTHRGMLSLLGAEFVRSGRLPAGIQHEVARLETYREYADYDRDFVATEDLVRAEREAADRVREAVLRFLASAGYGGAPAA
ncbi:MAG: HEPN domain-containing protein [Deltaproteobacteria bacterium]|nr:HEPN domain-containing protein [Deltaproteobacteria bacterium]